MPAYGRGIGYVNAGLGSAPGFGDNVQTGHYYYLFSQGGKNATAWVDGALRISPQVITRPLVIDRLAVDCTSGAASSNVKIVVYGSNAAGDTPVTNLYASAAISSVSSGILEATGVALTLAPGVYWFGGVAYGGAPTLSTSQVTGHPLVPIDIGTSAPSTGDAGSISQQTTGITTGTIPGTWAGSRASAAPPRVIVKVG